MSTEGLSAKELKAQKKAEKAQRRAAQKEASGLPSTTKPTHSNQQHHGPKSDFRVVPGDKRLSFFGHLEVSDRDLTSIAYTDVHPSILLLSLQISTYKVIGSTNRCRAMLEAFKDVINDYVTPPGTTISRNLTTHLGHQIEFLKQARPLSISMGNSIRWLKQEITTISIDLSEHTAKQNLIDAIDGFIRERIDLADRVIVQFAVQNIEDGNVVLTYGSSLVVKQSLIEAHKLGKRFRVIVADSRPLFEGKALVRELVKEGLSCTYILINALSYVMHDVSTIFLGAHAMLSNGLLYSRIGSGMVLTAAKSRNIPVLVLCESIKFTDRVQLDSVTFNELSSPQELVNISINPQQNEIESEGLKNWKQESNLSVLNLLYDLSPTGTIKKVITELGSLPPSAVPVVNSLSR